MRRQGFLETNFTISGAAKAQIDQIRQDYKARFADPPAVAMVAWGLYRPNSGKEFGNVVVSFYEQSQYEHIKPLIQEVSGLKLVFFTTEKHYANFQDKVLDYAEDRWFFLKAP